MTLGRRVALEAVLVPTLLLADLAEPTQLLQTFGLWTVSISTQLQVNTCWMYLHAVADGLGREEVVLAHC